MTTKISEMLPLGSVVKAPSAVCGGADDYWVVAAEPMDLSWLALRSDEKGEILPSLTSGQIMYEAVRDDRVKRIGAAPANVLAVLTALAKRDGESQAVIARAYQFACASGIRDMFIAAVKP